MFPSIPIVVGPLAADVIVKIERSAAENANRCHDSQEYHSGDQGIFDRGRSAPVSCESPYQAHVHLLLSPK